VQVLLGRSRVPDSTVTTLRSSRASDSAAASTTPHSEQNFAPAWLPWPHEGQTLTSKAYGEPEADHDLAASRFDLPI
jgi:hypothetical protein